MTIVQASKIIIAWCSILLLNCIDFSFASVYSSRFMFSSGLVPDINSNSKSKQHCDEFGTTLVSIHSAAQFTDLERLCDAIKAKHGSQMQCLVGVTYDASVKSFRNDDSTLVYSDGWFPGFPKENDATLSCVVFHKDNEQSKGLRNVPCENLQSIAPVCEGTSEVIIHIANDYIDGDKTFAILYGIGSAWQLSQGDDACSNQFGKKSQMIELESQSTLHQYYKLVHMEIAVKSSISTNVVAVTATFDDTTKRPTVRANIANAIASDPNDYFQIMACSFQSSECQATHAECAKLLEHEPTGWGWPIVCIVFGALIVGYVVFKKFMAHREVNKAKSAAGKVWNDTQWSKVDNQEPWAN